MLRPGLLAAVFLAACSTLASGQSVVDVLPATDGAWGLSYHDDFLWLGDDRDGFIYQIDPADGTVIITLPTPYDENHVSFGANHGVAWDGSGFWVAGDFGKDWLYKVSNTGAFLDTIPSPTEAVGGLAWDGTYLLITHYYPNNTAGILRVDRSDGSIIDTIPSQGQQPFGIEYDAVSTTIWNGMDDNDGNPEKIWNLTYPDGSILSSFDTPAQSPKGIALGGGFMWLVAGEIGGNGRRIYKIDLGGAGTPDITAIPDTQDFGIVALGTQGVRSQTLRNDGDGDLVITSVTASAPFSTEALTLPTTLIPGANLTFDVFFDPVVAGNFATSLQVMSNDVDEGTLDIPLTGTGVFADPTIVVTPPALNYPDTHLGLVRDLVITIENVGFATLSVTAITSDAAQFQVTEPTLPALLSTFETLDVQVIFEPDAVAPFNGSITVTSNDPDDPSVAVSASGDGIIRTYEPGAVIWSAQGIENVVSVQAIPDVTGNGISDAVMETYDAGADGDPHVALFGNSDGGGVRIWSVGEGMSGGWGDLCLDVSDDLDDDGHPEVLRGVAWGGRRAEVRDAHDGGLVWQFDTDPYDGGGWVYSVRSMPDVSGDGRPEVLAATGTAGPGAGARRLFCLDGATGTVRWSQFSPDAFLSCAWIEDVNDDGVTDALGGTGGNSEDDRVYCVSGASSGNGTVIWDFHTLGSVWSVNVIDDVTGDGIDDVIAGSWSNTVYCIDGVAGTEVWSTPVGSDVLRVEAIDDITGDGAQDVVIAQIGNTFRAINGVTGAQHWVFPTGGNVWSTYPMPDVNDDTVPDVLAGSQDNKVYCVSGADGSELWSTHVGALVFSVRPTVDVNGNGYPDVLAGTQFLGGSGGKMWCLEGGAVQVSVGDPSVVPDAGVRFVGLAPNPMPGAGVFTFETGGGAGDAIVVDIFDLSGRRIRSLTATAEGGRQRIDWDGRGTGGVTLSSGVYFYRIGMPGPDGARRLTETGRVTLLQ